LRGFFEEVLILNLLLIINKVTQLRAGTLNLQGFSNLFWFPRAGAGIHSGRASVQYFLWSTRRWRVANAFPRQRAHRYTQVPSNKCRGPVERQRNEVTARFNRPHFEGSVGCNEVPTGPLRNFVL